MEKFPFDLKKPSKCLRFKLASFLKLDACLQCDNEKCFWYSDPRTNSSYG